MKRILFFIVILMFAGISVIGQTKSKVTFTPLDSSYYIYQVDSGHLGFPDIIKLPDYTLMVVYREGSNHYLNGKVMRQYGMPNGYSWKQPELLYSLDSMDVRDASTTLLKNGDIGF